MIGKAKALIDFLYEQDKEKKFEVKEYKEKRSLNANSYFYVLQNRLAEVLRTGSDELHEILIKRYADATLITLPKDQNIEGYVKYYDVYKEGKVKGLEVIIYKVYKPSHEMNTKEFSRLLDGLISECKEVGIEPLTPNQLKELEGYEKC